MIIGKRQTGKTIKLIKLFVKTGDYIVILDMNTCQQMFELARKMKLTIPYPITFDEFLNKKYYAKGIKGFLIDTLGRLDKIYLK